jgi:photosystem II stability/assembly factor-like uncharacterized protein
MRALFLIAATALALPTQAQWTIQTTPTTADLRGIANAGNGIAWASGTEGTVLRTTDTGKTWHRCPTPPNADHLDFRGIQAFDANTAIVMSSGKGDLSRLYKTTDACQTWKLLFTNPDKEGFFDALQADKADAEEAYILGDSVDSSLRIWKWSEGSDLELAYEMKGKSSPNEGSFAASNSILQIVKTPQMLKEWKYVFRWSSGIPGHAYISSVRDEKNTCEPCREERNRADIPLSATNASSGIFSFDFRDEMVGVAVGGDYTKPSAIADSAFLTHDGGIKWIPSKTPPHGYRSAVAYDPTTKTWIIVGPNGTDISTDDGRNWHPLKPSPTDTPDADRNWNALSLPYVVGPHGRIGILNPTALK